jgi:hypothetical protein
LAKSKVPVYSRNATSIAERPLTTVSDAEAAQMIADGKAKRVSQRHAPLRIQLIQLVTPDINSPCSIGFKEVLANAGIGDKGFVARTRDKVAAWNSVSEPRLRAFVNL